MVISHFTGTKDAMCPITLCFVGDLTHPVAIQPAYNQPYELTALWRWILSTKKHPLLPSISCSLSDIVTLDLSGARMTESVLEVMLQTATEERDFRDGVSELSDALDRLNRSIAMVHRDTNDIMTEKLALEHRLEVMQGRFCLNNQKTEKKKRSFWCVVC
jgi:hypothetical protein